MIALPMRYRRWLVPILGPRTTKAMPTRVEVAILEQENRGEVLAKVVQLVIAAAWGALYLLSTPVRQEGFVVIPYALGIYVAVNGIGLFWAMRRRLPNWAVYFSIVFDMTLLYVVIWRFHVLADQPAALYLKAPTLAFVFVFITLRALRFQPAFVLVAGGTAVLGWLIMVAYAALADPGAVIANNFADYFTGNVILPTAELEKILAMALVTGILALALYRGRSLLIRATTETVAVRQLSRFFDSSVVEDIRSGESPLAPGEGRACEAAILNVDIRGFSNLVEHMPPSDVIAMLAAYQSRVVPIIQAHGGVIDKFMGDGIMATFGAVRPTDSYAADALRAMEAIRQDIGDWPQESELASVARQGIGIAVSAGPIVFGAVGDSDRLEVTVIGASVNLSAKLEKANKILGTEAVATRHAYDTAIQQGYAPRHRPDFIAASIEGVARNTPVVAWGLSRTERSSP
ncbi:adenylate/guanylate cyclase domain-containing protein [Mesorhizobium marinum]|uniref:adenylate/guanylate cyclase domain-containing protein n=1 Tax=Mesorhizobium marinum TaxID=3228790 RepID=UPI0034663436